MSATTKIHHGAETPTNEESMQVDFGSYWIDRSNGIMWQKTFLTDPPEYLPFMIRPEAIWVKVLDFKELLSRIKTPQNYYFPELLVVGGEEPAFGMKWIDQADQIEKSIFYIDGSLHNNIPELFFNVMVNNERKKIIQYLGANKLLSFEANAVGMPARTTAQINADLATLPPGSMAYCSTTGKIVYKSANGLEELTAKDAPKFLNGAGDPSNALTASTIINDYYLDTTSGNLWQRETYTGTITATTIVLAGNVQWKKLASLKGATGASAGKTYYIQGVPTNTDNVTQVGDYWLNTLTGKLYVKQDPNSPFDPDAGEFIFLTNARWFKVLRYSLLAT
ncbi:hypothetical protein [Runella sp.]|uniref:hypothetical protein n=1 Tax=Runella sp. TaxID=1960881 RepID=UPI003D109DD8